MYRVSTAQTNPKLQECATFLGLIYLFVMDRPKRSKHGKLKYTWVYEGINTCNMAESSAHQTKWRMV